MILKYFFGNPKEPGGILIKRSDFAWGVIHYAPVVPKQELF